MVRKKHCVLRDVDYCPGRLTTSSTTEFCSGVELGLSHQENNGDVMESGSLGAYWDLRWRNEREDAVA
jgi:hypothetical protein